MNILGLITARGGSKGISNKNIVELNGRPLISYTIDAAKKSKLLERTVLNTDSNEIIKIGIEHQIEVPFVRPSELAEDGTSSVDVILHHIQWMKKNENHIPDAILLLQPTSPLRTEKHIDQAIKIFAENNPNTLVSVTSVPHNYNPYNIMEMKDGTLVNYHNEETSFNRYQRQNLPKLYARNGPAILLIRSEFLLKNRAIYGDNCMGYEMSQEDSIDIDTITDLKIAEGLLKKRNKNNG